MSRMFYGLGKGFKCKTGFTDSGILKSFVCDFVRPPFNINGSQFVRDTGALNDTPMPFGAEGNINYVLETVTATDSTIVSAFIFGIVEAVAATDSALIFIMNPLLGGLSEIEFAQEGSGIGAGLATGISTIEFESIGTGLSGIVSTGESTIELISNGICFATIIGIGQSNIELRTSGLGSYTLVGTGRSIIEIISGGIASQGIVGIGNSIIEMGTVGTGFTGIVGTGTASIVFTTKGLSEFIIIATDYTCIVINTKTGAVSEYDNYDFNSFCEFNGKTLGCRVDGIYELDGVDDNGAAIDAYVKWGFLDPNLPTKSSLVEGFLSGESTGDIKVTTICDEDQSCEDILKYLTIRRDHPVRIAKGFKGRLYEVKIENINGSGFTLNSYRVLARELKKQR